MSRKSPTSAWSYKAGEKGRNRVRVFDWPGHGLWIDYKEKGERHREPLGHEDRDRAKRQADDIAAQLGAIDREISAPAAELRVGTLFDMYEVEVTPTKSKAVQASDRRVMSWAEACWGKETPVSSLDRRHWDRLIEQRRRGVYGRGKSRDSTIRNMLGLLVAIMHWAETVRVAGRPLLLVNPFRGFPSPIERNPSRPTLTPEEVVAVFRAAPKVSPRVALFLAIAYETGKREMAIASLRWSDIDLTKRVITWRAAFDKTKTDHTAPISAECAAALRAEQRTSRAIGDAWLFPNRKGTGPITRQAVQQWWRRLEVVGGIARIRGRGWHSCRRTLATDLAASGASLKTIMEIVGWKTQDTALLYIQPTDSDKRVALKTRRRADVG